MMTSTAQMDTAQSDGADTATVLLYAQDNVNIHPGRGRARLPGRLSLIKNCGVLFVAWTPYKQQATEQEAIDVASETIAAGNNNGNGGSGGTSSNKSNNGGGSGSGATAAGAKRDRNLYTVHPIPVYDISALRIHTPLGGKHFIIIVLSSGLSLPPLYFHAGKVRTFLDTMKVHVTLMRSWDDKNVFLVNDISDPLQRSLMSLELSDVLSKGRPLASGAAGSKSLARSGGETSGSAVGDASSTSSSLLESTMNTMLGWLSSSIFRGIDDEGFGFDLESSFLPTPPPTSSTATSPLSSVPPPSVASSSAAAAGARKSVDDDGPTLEGDCGVFEILEESESTMEDAYARACRPRPPPLSADEFAGLQDSEGRIALGDEGTLRSRVFYGGVAANVRKELWPLLLGTHSFSSTSAERVQEAEAQRKEYVTLRAQWESIGRRQRQRWTKFRERKSQIERDVRRTDRGLAFYAKEGNPNTTLLLKILVTYSFYNFDLGYCQGMSDILSPILYIMQDEAKAFWCFVSFMEHIAPNFHRDQSGMHAQLLVLRNVMRLLDPQLHAHFERHDCLNYFFCFRWLLIFFKRELSCPDILRLWEALWSRHVCHHFQIFIAAAVLIKHRRHILDNNLGFDELLRFVNTLAGKIDLNAALRDAEVLFKVRRVNVYLMPMTHCSLHFLSQRCCSCVLTRYLFTYSLSLSLSFVFFWRVHCFHT